MKIRRSNPLLLTLLLLMTMLLLPLNGRSVQGQETINVILTPSAVEVDAGDTFTLRVQVQSGTEAFTGVNVFLNFDPSHLQVNSITRIENFDFDRPNNGYDNATGEAEYGSANIDPLTGTIDFIEIEFTAVSAAASTDITFSTSGLRMTTVTNGLNPLPIAVQGASVTINAQPDAVSVLLTPDTVTVDEGQTFTLTAQVQSGTQAFSAVEAAINFDPTYLAVNELTLVGSFISPDNDLSDNFDNGSGTIDVVAGIAGGTSGTVSFLEIEFTALTDISSTDVLFATGGSRTTQVAFGLNPLEIEVAGSTITINDVVQTATLNGSVTFQGRLDQTETLRVRLYEAGTTNLLLDTTTNVDAAGNFTLPGLQPGAYSIAVKINTHLQEVEEMTLVAGSNTVTFDELLAGDANNDNFVDLGDFSLLSSTFNQVGSDLPADFNNDSIVDLADFSLLSGNFGLSGEVPAN